MPIRGSGKHTREEWKKPTEKMRKRPHRGFSLSHELHARLDELPRGTASGHAEAALRAYLYMPQLEDAPPRPSEPTPQK